VEWAEYLKFKDGDEEIKVFIVNGPMHQKTFKAPVQMQNYANKIPEFRRKASDFEHSNVRVRDIWLIRRQPGCF